MQYFLNIKSTFKRYFVIIAGIALIIYVVIQNPGLASVSAAIGGAAISYRLTRMREVESRLFEKKQKVYDQQSETFADLFWFNVGKQSNGARLERMIQFKETLLLWGSPSIIMAYHEWEEAADASTNETLGESLLKYEKLILEIRKDLGYEDSSLPEGSLLEFFLKPGELKRLFPEE